MRLPNIDPPELEMAFGSGSEMISYYLDLETGEVISVSDEERGLLEHTISGFGAFRYFKEVLLDYPAARQHWFQFKPERLQQRMLDWLEAHGITPT